MTTNLQEVRTAAERCSQPANVEDWEQCEADIDTLRDYALSAIPPDPDAAMTAEWLQEVWGVDEEFYDGQMYYWLPVGIGDCCLNTEFADDGGIRVYLYDAGAERIATELPCITTRHQFTQLVNALGITPKARRRGSASLIVDG